MISYKEVLPHIYTIALPLPKNPLKELNLYLIYFGDDNLLIDTGFDHPETFEHLKEFINHIKLTPKNTRLYLTHLHSDHTGLAYYFQEHGYEILMGDVDGKILQSGFDPNGKQWKNIALFGQLQGLQADQLEIENHPGFRYRPKQKINYTPLHPGQTLRVGDFEFITLDLSGHTPGQLGLYEKNHQYLFSGDHILAKITPNITFWGYDVGDSLGTYFKNLDQVDQLDVKYVFSSHRSLIEDHHKRIRELRQHHNERLDEALQALRKSNFSTVRDVTKQLHWDIRSKNWDDFPKSQKWFAAGEAHAHLEHLRVKKMVDCKEENGVLYYFIR